MSAQPDLRSLSSGFQLGEWTVKPEDGSLVSPDTSQRLEPLLTRLLVFLCSRHGQVVSKEELVEAVWHNRFISDATIKATFYQLRKALRDDRWKPRFIETLPKRGYRILIAPSPVSEASVNAVAHAADDFSDKGMALIAGSPSVASLNQALLYFERAVESDPDNARACAGLAHTYISMAAHGVMRGTDLMLRADGCARRAVAAAPAVARGHSAQAITELLYRRRPRHAETCFLHAVDLDASDTVAHRWYAKLLSAEGRHDEALRHLQSALTVEPLSLVLRRDRVEALFHARRYDQTIHEARQLIEMTGGPASDTQLGLAWVHLSAGHEQQAFDATRAGFSGAGVSPQLLADATQAFARAGMQAVLRLWLAWMQQQASVGQLSIDLLVLNALLRETDNVLTALHMLAAESHPILLWLPVSPVFDQVRADRRVADFVRQLGFEVRL